MFNIFKKSSYVNIISIMSLYLTDLIGDLIRQNTYLPKVQIIKENNTSIKGMLITAILNLC